MARSKEKRQAFLSPSASIASPFVATLIDSSLPKSERGFCERFSGSPPLPPSPIVKKSRPFGAKASMPPLWFPYGSRLEKSCAR